MKCDKCGKEIPQGDQVFNIIQAETGRSIEVCQSCMLQRYGGGGSASPTAKPQDPSKKPWWKFW